MQGKVVPFKNWYIFPKKIIYVYSVKYIDKSLTFITKQLLKSHHWQIMIIIVLIG